MSYACFLCSCCSFNTDYSFKLHLMETHDWESETQLINENFVCVKGKELNCPYCDLGYRYFNSYLYHVLSTCPIVERKHLYWNRHDKVMSIFCEAMCQVFSDRDWIIMNALEDSYCCLPLGAPSSSDNNICPDIVVYSQKRKEAVVVEISVSWEEDIPRARLEAIDRIQIWIQQLKLHGYNCRHYTVEVGVRGLLSNSFYNCLEEIGLRRDDISECADLVSYTVIANSLSIVSGKGAFKGGEPLTTKSNEQKTVCSQLLRFVNSALALLDLLIVPSSQIVCRSTK